MSLKQLPKEQVQTVCQDTLECLSSADISIPASVVESIVSMKTILRALLSEQLVLAQEEGAPAVPEPAEPSKKGSKKAA
jgi:hypothetical protein